MSRTTLRFDPAGNIACLHTEVIDLRELGRLAVVRATEIVFEPISQQWEVRSAEDGTLLHQNPSRENCLSWERIHLQPGGNAELQPQHFNPIPIPYEIHRIHSASGPGHHPGFVWSEQGPAPL